MKLSGWHRILIVVSLAWLLAFAGFVIVEYHNSVWYCEYVGTGSACEHAFWSWIYVAAEKFSLSIKIGKTVAVAFIPIAALWLFFAALRWVIDGFRK